jgi:hypothetical protein
MAEKQLSFPDYVKAAFYWRFKVPLLGHLRLNIFALLSVSVLGLLNPAFWLLGIALESAYLLFVPGDERFQNIVQGQQLLDLQNTWKKRRDTILTKLDAPSVARYQILLEQSSAIQKSSDASAAEELHGYGLNQLLWTFLQLLASRSKIIWMLRTVSEEKLAKEILELEKKVSSEESGSPLYTSHNSTLEITRKRLENIRRASTDLDVIEAELVRIEQQFALFREESTLSTNSSVVTAKLDGVMQSLQETSKWLSAHQDLLDDSVDEIPPELFSMHSNPVKE